MKQMNENQLRFWRPRRPSAGLKRRIFGLAEDDLPNARWLWNCLAPTMACVLLTLMAFSHEGNGLGEKFPVAMLLSNRDSVVYAAGAAETAQNHVAAVTFDSTNRSGIKSIVGFTPTTNFSN